MKAAGIPSQAAAPPVVGTAAAAPTAAEDSGGDFVGMLMQLLGGNAPAAISATPVKLAPTAADDSEDPEALAAMLALPLPVQLLTLPWAAQPSTGAAPGADPLELLGLGSGGRNPADTLLGMQSDAANAAPDTQPGDGSGDGSGNDAGVGSLSPFNEAMRTRATHSENIASRPLHAPVGSERWAEELGTRLTWMVERGQQVASLRLSPDNLGPLEVRISITDDKASVWFGAAHADTRAAVEQALPRLREMFTAQGLSLTDAGVFHEPPRDQSSASSRNFGANSPDARQEGELTISSRGVGLFDAYA